MNAKCITSGSDDSYRIGRSKLPNDMPGSVPLPTHCTIKLVALGWKHGHIVINGNQMYSWGIGKSFRLGTGNKFSTEVPVKVSMPSNFEIKMIAAGDAFGCAISNDGKLLAWGRNYAQSPRKFPLPSPAKYLSCGSNSILCALEDGSVQLLQSSDSTKNIKIPNEKVVMTAAGSSHYLALTYSGTVYSWGSAIFSGHSSNHDEPTPLRFSESPIAAVFAYQDNSWFVDKKNAVYRCGKNEEGCLGSGDIIPIRTPTKLDYDFDSGEVIQIACGDNLTIVLTNAGKAFAAGNPKECRSAIDPKFYDDCKYFHPCTHGVEANVTQIACGCYSGAFVINGDYHPCHQFFERNYKDFMVYSKPAEYFIFKNSSLLISPTSPFLDSVGLKSEDIIQFHDGVYAKVIGVSKEGQIITITNKGVGRKIEALDYKGVLNELCLSERSDHNIISYKDSYGKFIQLDTSDTELFEFKGIKYNDVLPNGSKIAGCRGIHLYAYNSKNGENVVTEISIDQVTEIERNNKPIKLMKFINMKDDMFVEKEDEDLESIKSLYFHISYGAGILAGKVHDFYAYKFASDFGFCRLLKDECLAVRKKDEFVNCILCPTFDKISVSISSNKSKNLCPFDFVETKDGYGCIAGFYSGKVAVWLEKNIGHRGTVSLYSIEDVVPKARLFAPLVVNGLSANSDDFDRFHLLPGDQIELENQFFLVAGTKDGKIFVDENGQLKEFDWKRAKLVRRHLYAGLINQDGNSYECSPKSLISGDLVEYGKKTENGKVLGLFDHSTLLLKNDKNQYAKCPFSLPKIE